MPDTTHPEGVPLNVWICPTGTGSALRRHVAARLVDTYSSKGSVVADLAPGRGEVFAAIVAAGRSAMALRGARGRGRCRVSPLDELSETADLAIAIPPATSLGSTSAPDFSPPAGVMAGRAARVLSSGGYLAMAVTSARRRSDPVAASVAAVTAHDFVYFQHVVALVAIGAGTRRFENDRRGVGHVDVVVFRRVA